MLQFTNEAHMKIISHRKQLLFHDPGSSAQAPSVNRAWNTWPGSAEVATGWNFRGSGKKNCSIRTHFQRANLATDSFLYAVWIDILFYCHFFVLFFLRRVLNVLCSCLDTFLFLECRYRFQELLLQSQLDNRLDNGWGTDYEELILLFV